MLDEMDNLRLEDSSLMSSSIVAHRTKKIRNKTTNFYHLNDDFAVNKHTIKEGDDRAKSTTDYVKHKKLEDESITSSKKFENDLHIPLLD
jgi:hypothetical protein